MTFVLYYFAKGVSQIQDPLSIYYFSLKHKVVIFYKDFIHIYNYAFLLFTTL